MDRGDMELTLKDYNAIEKELRNRLETKDKFDSINTKKTASQSLDASLILGKPVCLSAVY